jgi:hypothetical protein
MLCTLFGDQIRGMGGTGAGGLLPYHVPLVGDSFFLHSGWLYPKQPM